MPQEWNKMCIFRYCNVGCPELYTVEYALKCCVECWSWSWEGRGMARCWVTVQLMKTVPLHLTPISEMGLWKHWGWKLGLARIPQTHLLPFAEPCWFTQVHTYTHTQALSTTHYSLSITFCLSLTLTYPRHAPKGFVRHWWEGEKADDSWVCDWSVTYYFQEASLTSPTLYPAPFPKPTKQKQQSTGRTRDCECPCSDCWSVGLLVFITPNDIQAPCGKQPPVDPTLIWTEMASCESLSNICMVFGEYTVSLWSILICC